MPRATPSFESGYFLAIEDKSFPSTLLSASLLMTQFIYYDYYGASVFRTSTGTNRILWA
jgi:hypothetical protein